jgi:D-tyrosyl-tRNA(Tyr) deacylase
VPGADARLRIRALIALLQRVSSASVRVDGIETGSIGAGLLVFIGIRPADTAPDGLRLLDRVLQYRVFGDAAGKMNLSLLDIGGGLLLVPQFTLAADTRHGLRPGFSTAAPPAQAGPLFEDLLLQARRRHERVCAGVFGAHMQVSLVNDGPVTLWLES